MRAKMHRAHLEGSQRLGDGGNDELQQERQTCAAEERTQSQRRPPWQRRGRGRGAEGRLEHDARRSVNDQRYLVGVDQPEFAELLFEHPVQGGDVFDVDRLAARFGGQRIQEDIVPRFADPDRRNLDTFERSFVGQVHACLLIAIGAAVGDQNQVIYGSADRPAAYLFHAGPQPLENLSGTAGLDFREAAIGRSRGEVGIGGDEEFGLVAESHQAESVLRAKQADDFDRRRAGGIQTLAGHGGRPVEHQAHVQWRGGGRVVARRRGGGGGGGGGVGPRGGLCRRAAVGWGGRRRRR